MFRPFDSVIPFLGIFLKELTRNKNEDLAVKMLIILYLCRICQNEIMKIWMETRHPPQGKSLN